MVKPHVKFLCAFKGLEMKFIGLKNWKVVSGPFVTCSSSVSIRLMSIKD